MGWRGRIAPTSTHEKGAACHPVPRPGLSAARPCDGLLVKPGVRSGLHSCSHPHPIVPVPGLEAPLPQLNGPGSARPPLQPAPCGAADPQRHQQTPGWRGRVAERAEGCSRQDCSLRGTHPFRVSQGPATGPGREGISDKALAKVDAFIRPALNRLWAGGPGRMPGTRPGLARLLCLPLLCILF